LRIEGVCLAIQADRLVVSMVRWIVVSGILLMYAVFSTAGEHSVL